MVSMFFGQYLLELGLVSREALLDALARQRRCNRSLLDLAVSQGLVSASQREAILHLFRTTERSLAEICVEDGYLERSRVGQLMEAQRVGWLRIGEALVEGGHLTPEALAEHLEVYRARQAEIQSQVEHGFGGLEEPETVRAFFSLASFYLGRLLGASAKLGAVDRVGAGIAPGRRRFAQRFVGDRELSLAVDLDDRQATELARGMLGQDAPLAPETVADAVCELVNVVGGNACTRMETMGWRLRPEPPTASGPGPGVEPDGPAVRAVALVGDDRVELRLFGVGRRGQ